MAVVLVVFEAGLVDEDLLAGLLVAAGFAGGELGLEVLKGHFFEAAGGL